METDKKLQLRIIKPEKSLSEFVEHFLLIHNLSDISKSIIMPNGKIDMQFSKTVNDKLCVSLIGLETEPKSFPKLNKKAFFFVISFYPLAVEYVFHHSIAEILNSNKKLPMDFWGFTADDLNDFDCFCIKASQKIKSQLWAAPDKRKLKLFKSIFERNGDVNIKELAETVFWSARQINQYFSHQFGLSLKTYCGILRFQASLLHIQKGKLSPELNYYDQSHFIKEIKKLSGASPKELFRNPNSRFLQFLHSPKL